MAFVKVALAKLLIPLNLSIVLKVVLDVQERALNHGIQISLKTKSGSSSQLDSQVPLSPALPDDRRRS